jgi:hypothetical protein
MTNFRRMVASLAVLTVAMGTAPSARGQGSPPLRVDARGDSATVLAGDRPVLRYVTVKPPDVKLPVDSAAYFHPVVTPAGVVVTDVAPKDHPHHRGIFLAWVEMHGNKDADFWGWGEHAPIKDRRIVCRGVAKGGATRDGPVAAFQTRSDWTAEGDLVVRELLDVAVRQDLSAGANVIDLTYTLTPTSDLTLSRWAFSGFCVRTRGDGKVTAYGPSGEVKLPNPSHLKPESDWPAAAWYGYTLRFDDGKVAGVAVIDHPRNPPSLWHNHRDIRMLNPCVVAPAEVKLKANEPLVLRYRVVAHDGATPGNELDRLAAEWRKKEARGQGDKGTR